MSPTSRGSLDHSSTCQWRPFRQQPGVNVAGIPIDKKVVINRRLSIRILIDNPFSRVVVTTQLLIRQPSYQPQLITRLGLSIVDNKWNLELDKWNPRNPHRVETYSLHVPDTYNSTHRQRLGSSRTRKTRQKNPQKKKKLAKKLLFQELRHPTGPFPVSPVPVLAGEVAHRYRL